MAQEKISSAIRDRVPRFLLDEHSSFVDFLDAYNQFLESDRTIKVSLEDIVSFFDYTTVLDVDMNQIVLPDDSNINVSAEKYLSDVVFSSDVDFYLINGKNLNSVVAISDNILSREIGMLFSEGPYLVNIADYVDPSYLLVSPLVTDEFAITDITRGIVETILALDSASSTFTKSSADSQTSTDNVLPFDIGLGKSDSSSPLDAAAISYSTIKADTQTLLDAAAKALSTNRTEFLSAVADVITSKSLDPTKQDTQSLVDAIVEKIAYPLYQETAYALEDVSIGVSDSAQEVASASENIQAIGFGKNILDSASAGDSLSIESIFSLGDIALATESISISMNAALLETGDYMLPEDYVPDNYFGGSIDDNLTTQ